MDISRYYHAICLVVRHMVLESPLKNMPASPAFRVHDVTERCQEALHEPAEISLTAQDIQVKMIGDKAVAANLYVELPGKLLQLVKKYFIWSGNGKLSVSGSLC